MNKSVCVRFFFPNKYREARVATYDDEKIQLNILASVLVKRVNYHEAPWFYRLEKCSSKVLLGDGEMVGVWRGGA